MKSSNLKTPLSYYGGKQKLAGRILPLISDHSLYAEPFIGGGAVFWQKPASGIEVINDTNASLMKFYRVVKENYIDLEKLVRITLHSREAHRKAGVIYENPDLFTDLQVAWSIWVRSSQSFSSLLDGSWGYDKAKNHTTKKITNKRDSFTEDLAIRLQNVQLECADATYIIKSRDSERAFFYCDPPYVNSNCGHYDGYSEYDFEALLNTLSGIKGRFLLSSYPSDQLDRFIAICGWSTVSIEQRVSVNKGMGKSKTEVLTANYPIE